MSSPAFNPNAAYQAAPPAFDPGADYQPATAAAKTPAEPGAFDVDYPKTSAAWATASGLQSVGRGITNAAKGTLQMFDPRPQSDDEDALVDADQRFRAVLPVYRILKSIGHTASDARQLAGAVHDINNSPDPVGTYMNAAQEMAGEGAGQAIVGAATEGLAKGAGAAANAVKGSAAASAPIRFAARTAETALNQKLVPLRKIANLMTPADAAEALEVKVPGRDFGLQKPAPAPAAELDATGENKPFAGGPDEPPAPKPARELDATGENKPFAGGMDEFTGKPAAKPQAAAAPVSRPSTPAPAAASPASATAATSAVSAPETVAAESTAAPEAAATPKRSIVTDPETGKPEFSDVISKRDEIIDKLSTIADKIKTEQKTAAASRVPAASEDLTNLLQQSLDLVQAQKGGVHTTAAPADLLKRWGVDEQSFTEGRSQTRGMKPDESSAAIDQLTAAYKRGDRVQPLLETRDAGNNIIDVDGRGRALAAHKAGIERVPVIVRRMPAPAAP